MTNWICRRYQRIHKLMDIGITRSTSCKSKIIYLPVESQWYPGCTWSQQMWSPGKNRDPQLHQTLDPKTWKSCSTSLQLEKREWGRRILISFRSSFQLYTAIQPISLKKTSVYCYSNNPKKKDPTWNNTISSNCAHGYGCQHGLWRDEINEQKLNWIKMLHVEDLTKMVQWCYVKKPQNKTPSLPTL